MANVAKIAKLGVECVGRIERRNVNVNVNVNANVNVNVNVNVHAHANENDLERTWPTFRRPSPKLSSLADTIHCLLSAPD